ncbi:hypothetical protein Q3A80_31775 [Burkholderia sp. SR8]|uniref:hypothetical protein n=1 Tax=Burkholderia sp. SR8 TaxID=3062277 RepID=UPI004062ACF8
MKTVLAFVAVNMGGLRCCTRVTESRIRRELMIFCCECAAGFSDDVGMQDAGYLDALVRMFDQALKAVSALPDGRRPALLTRLDAVRRISHNFGYGLGDAMDELLAEYGADG